MVEIFVLMPELNDSSKLFVRWSCKYTQNDAGPSFVIHWSHVLHEFIEPRSVDIWFDFKQLKCQNDFVFSYYCRRVNFLYSFWASSFDFSNWRKPLIFFALLRSACAKWNQQPNSWAEGYCFFKSICKTFLKIGCNGIRSQFPFLF